MICSCLQIGIQYTFYRAHPPPPTMNILEKIIAHKHLEVAERRARVPMAMLEVQPLCQREVLSLSAHLLHPDKSGIIAEFKRRSPSKGDINTVAAVEAVTTGYAQAGVSALSVLTDVSFFGGQDADLLTARAHNAIPVLRKDFVVDEYQILEARSLGADAILLIAACLDKATLHRLAQYARGLGLEVLVELHGKPELDKLSPLANAVGVNNRNLATFEVSLEHSIALLPDLPKDMVRVAESGLDDPQAVVTLRHAGFQGFLIGEYFMRADDPAARCREFTQRVKDLEQLMNGAIA